MYKDELKRKLFNKLESTDDSMGYIFDALIENWATVKMALYIYYFENREVLSKPDEITSPEL